jgi:hypothetical protein
MLSIPGLDKALGYLKPMRAGNGLEALFCTVMPAILIIYAILVGAKNQVNPISCWPPYQWKPEWDRYAQDQCYSQYVFAHPFNNETLKLEKMPGYAVMEARRIGFFQWLGIAAALQAIGFYLPASLWSRLKKQSCKYSN